MKRFIFSISCLILWSSVTGQGQPFPKAGILALAGPVTLLYQSKNLPLKQKDFLYSGDVIEVKKNGLVKLVTPDLRYIDISLPGKYNVDDLLKKLDTKSTGISAKYAGLIWHELFQPQNLKELVSPVIIGSVTGGASRGCSTILLPVANIKTSTDTLEVKWRSASGMEWYRFVVEDDQKNEVMHLLTRDTTLLLLRSTLLHAASSSYYLTVSGPAECPETRIKFTFLSDAEKQRQVDETVKTAAAIPENFFRLITISDRLASQGCYREAFDYHNQALNSIGQK